MWPIRTATFSKTDENGLIYCHNHSGKLVLPNKRKELKYMIRHSANKQLGQHTLAQQTFGQQTCQQTLRQKSFGRQMLGQLTLGHQTLGHQTLPIDI